MKPTKLLLLAALALPMAAQAATWVGSTDTDWATAANWDVLPASGAALTFGAAGSAGSTLTNTLTDPSFNITGITFSSGAAAYTMSGNAFTLSGNITNSSTALQTLNQNITLGAASTVTTTTGGGNVTLGGSISGAYKITATGAGLLTLAGTNSISDLSIGGTTASGTVVNTGTLNVSGTFVGAFAGGTSSTFNNSGTLSVGGNFLVADNNVGTRTGTINQTAGSVTLSTAGSVIVGSRIGTTGSYNLSGGTLNVLNTTFGLTTGGNASGTLSISGTATANLKGVNFTGSTSSTGTLTMTGGRLNIGATGITNASGGGTRNFTLGAATVGAFANWSTTQNITLSNAATGTTFDTLDSVDGVTGRTITLSGALSSTGKLNKVGDGTLALTVANSYSGGTTVTGGTVSFANGALGTTGAITMNGGALQWNGTNTQDVSGRLTLVAGKAATFDTGANAVSFANAIGSGTTASLVKAGAGTLTLNAANTYTGGTSVTAGTLKLGNASALNSGAVLVSGGALDLNGYAITNDVTLAGTGALINSAGTGVALNNLALGTAGSVGTNGQTLTVNGALTGSGTITGSVAVNGSLAIGNSPGLISVTGDTTLSAASTSLFEIGGLARGTGYDALNVSGLLTLDGAISVVTWNGFDTTSLTAGSSFDLIDWGTLDASGFNVATDLNLSALTLGGGLAWDTSAFLTDGSIAVTAVPEPSTYGLLGAGALAAVAFVRRRRKFAGTAV